MRKMWTILVPYFLVVRSSLKQCLRGRIGLRQNELGWILSYCGESA